MNRSLREALTAAATPASTYSSSAPVGYASEIRYGVVMYGGVSLALYINGVTNELYEMACATPTSGVAKSVITNEGTQEIYARLAWLVNNAGLIKTYSNHIQRRGKQGPERPSDVWNQLDTTGQSPTRLVVDVIAGTSAGAINGIFLAKALVNGEQFSPLAQMWVQEGDIGKLLHDSQSYNDLEGVDDASMCPKSLLNSNRMYCRLFDALEGMKPINNDGQRKPVVEEMDLFVTTTDIEGSPVPLRLFDKVVYERRYKQHFHFAYRYERNDFDKNNFGFLAFAARCTSAFPFAFEPMTLKAAMDLKPGFFAEEKQRRFFPHLPRKEVGDGRHCSRAFGDGGYLDNKPFSYVAETLSVRQATVPVQRKIVYIEPSPEALPTNFTHQHSPLPPNALKHSLAALISIPRYETIREDLQVVLDRNRRIESVERIVRDGEIYLQETMSSGYRSIAPPPIGP